MKPTTVSGLHHVTAIASDPQRNLDFYVGTLGLRLIKRTINFDDPGSYHFYFGDSAGTPGTILTFFPWPRARRGQRGVGEVAATAFMIPTGSAEFWLERLRSHQVSAERAPCRFGDVVIRLADPDGMILELIETPAAPGVQPWAAGPVAIENALRGLHGVSAALRDIGPTARLLTEAFGYQLAQKEKDRLRLATPGDSRIGNTIDLVALPEGQRGRQSAGSVHHIAFRVANDDDQIAWRQRLNALGFQVSEVMDRTYFHSIYFREPGGILFEIATDGPGFTADESPAELGSHLCLPPWMEDERAGIEASLPNIQVPVAVQV
jgi:glyoxalase family protein